MTSDQTPWSELGRVGAGWTYPLSERQMFVETIENVSRWSSDRWRETAEAAIRLARKVATDDSVRQRSLDLFLRASSSGV